MRRKSTTAKNVRKKHFLSPMYFYTANPVLFPVYRAAIKGSFFFFTTFYLFSKNEDQEAVVAMKKVFSSRS
jgi:hypothetical protein